MDDLFARHNEGTVREALAVADRVITCLMNAEKEMPFVGALDEDDLDAMNRTLGIMAAALAIGPAMQMTHLTQREMLTGIDSLMPLAGALAEHLARGEMVT